MTVVGAGRMLGRDPLDELCCWGRCQRPIWDAHAPLCREHLFRAWFAYQSHASDALRLEMESARTTRAERRAETGVVYFMRFGDRIKIGFTGNLQQRLVDVPHDELLLTMPGTMADEKRCHAAFAHLRETGEWFRAEPDLLDFIADLSA